ncbi:MAG TPA: ABC transporter ATP-binding protein [Pusillimonas sp.]|uniref:ABC transporter ATP-binding protein n=1 Tax=Pusillimonas sp. TaxID=3040095 RepID=UPI002BD863C6|nr:ABC transporter ATP-binding protein [Pusillimonas sp.]HUH86911.1 ABC transporter ATP-binding protein [Pusillimonas sp.]
MGNQKGIRVDRVSRHFDGVKAVDEVSFSLSPGETLALVGPNGAGKSTLIQLVSGIEHLSGGHISVDGRRVDRLAPERIARLGVGRSFQTSRVFPALSVWDSVMLGAQPRLLTGSPGGRLANPLYELLAGLMPMRRWNERVAEQESIVRETLQLFGERLWPRRQQPAFSLSYANRRRLEIARVLAGRPSYLLLDEPAAGMNPTETGELTNLLHELRRMRPELGILVVEHKLSLVRSVADRVIVLNQGKVLAEGDADHALDHPEVVEAYLGRVRTRPTLSDAHLG